MIIFDFNFLTVFNKCCFSAAHFALLDEDFLMIWTFSDNPKFSQGQWPFLFHNPTASI